MSKATDWADNIMRDCLTAAGPDVEAGLVAGEVLLSILPLPDEVTIEQEEVDDDGNDPIPVDLNASLNTFFAFDIFNRQAQGILNRSLTVAKGMSASARKDLEAALKKASTGSGEAILNFIDKYRVQLAKILTQTQLASVLSGAKEVADKVPTLAEFPGAVPPPPTLEPQQAVKLIERLEELPPDERAEEIYKLPGPEQVYVNQAIAVRAAPPPSIPLIVPQRGGRGAPEDVHLVTIDEAVRNLAERNVMNRQKYDALESAARAKAFTVANVQAEETLTKIRDSLAENVREGADYETWRKKVMDEVDQGTFMSDAHQETVFRTNVQSGFSDGQEAILNHPLVRSGFPYRIYDAIHDDRVRKEHLALDTSGIDGTNVYRADDPVWQLFRPPWGYNCRCSATPATVRLAAEKGIKEAQTWLDTGVEPANKAWVKMPDFKPPPGFQRAVASVPMSIQLSLQPLTTFKKQEETDTELLYGQSEGWGAITGGALDTAHERNTNKVKVLKAKTAKGKRIRRSLFKRLRVKRKWKPAVSLSVDTSGHQHKGKGEGGGQFTKSEDKSSTINSDQNLAPPDVFVATKKLAKLKIKNAPTPTKEQIIKARIELKLAREGKIRAGGENRGGGSVDRRRQRENLFKEFGGEERGYICCHGCGRKLHHTIPNDSNLERLERGKIFVKCQGGGYQLPNLLPECFQCNRSRNDSQIRKEVKC